MMNTEDYIIQANSGKKVDLSPTNARRKVWFYILTSIIVFSSISGLFIYNKGLNWSSLFVCFTLFAFLGITIILVLKDYSLVSVKSGNLIISDIKKEKNLVTSIRSVRKLKTTRVGRVHFTSFNYHLDGRNRRAVILKRVPLSDLAPEVVLRKLKEEKEKANL